MRINYKWARRIADSIDTAVSSEISSKAQRNASLCWNTKAPWNRAFCKLFGNAAEAFHSRQGRLWSFPTNRNTQRRWESLHALRILRCWLDNHDWDNILPSSWTTEFTHCSITIRFDIAIDRYTMWNNKRDWLLYDNRVFCLNSIF